MHMDEIFKRAKEIGGQAAVDAMKAAHAREQEVIEQFTDVIWNEIDKTPNALIALVAMTEAASNVYARCIATLGDVRDMPKQQQLELAIKSIVTNLNGLWEAMAVEDSVKSGDAAKDIFDAAKRFRDRGEK